MEHIPRAQPRNCMLHARQLLMFCPRTCLCLRLPVALSTCTEDTRSLIFNFAGKEGLVCCSNFCSYCVYFIHCLFVTLLISNCHHSRVLITSQRARALARALIMHMQIIAVGVTNTRHQQKARFITFVVAFGQC